MLRPAHRLLLAVVLAASAPAFAQLAFSKPDLRDRAFEPVNPATYPNLQPTVIGIARNGNVYVGGWFTTVDGQPRRSIARLKPDGALDAWAPTLPDSIGRPYLAVEDAAGNVAVASEFESLTSPRYLLYIPAATEVGVKVETESEQSGRRYQKLAFDDAGALFALVSRDCAFAAAAQDAVVRKFGGTTLDATFALSLPPYSPPGPSTGALPACLTSVGIDGDKLYVGGRFDPGLVRASTVTGAIDATWKPFQRTYVEALQVAPGSVYSLGHTFDPDSYGARRISTSGGTDGVPDATFNVPLYREDARYGRAMALDAAGGHLYVTAASGQFIDDIREVVALSLTAGVVAEGWDPGPRKGPETTDTAAVEHLMVLGDRVLVGGRFTYMGPDTRPRLAALPLASAPVDWPVLRADAPDVIDFGTSFVAGSRSRSFTITNVGTRDLALHPVHYYLPGIFSETHTCGAALAPNASCTITITAALKPASAYVPDGFFVTAMTLVSNAPGGRKTLTLLSSGGSAYDFDAATLRFPATVVGTARSATVNLRSHLDGPLAIEEIRLVHPDPGRQADYTVSHSCPASLPARGSCPVTITYHPKSVRTVFPSRLRVAAGASGREVYVDGISLALDGDDDADGIPNGVEIAMGRDPLVKDNDLFASTQLFVMQQYRDFLGRAPEDGGTAFWVARLASGSVTREGLAAEFLASAEFEARVAPIARLYYSYLLRVPDYVGLDYWIGRYRSGDSLETVSGLFAASPEFAARYGSLDDPQFVDRVYRNVLGRAPDAAGLSFWTGMLAASTSRGQMMVSFSESPEYRALTASEVFVTMVYAGMLRRAPDAEGFAGWVNFLDAGNSREALIRTVIESPEYRKRFLP